jgi:hypothetical protein
MTTIAILGAGRVGSTLATGFASAGHDIVVGLRDANQQSPSWAVPAIGFDTLGAAASRADIVVNAMPGDVAVETLVALAPQLAGKILVDVANATTRRANGMPGGLLYPESSLGEQLQLALPQTRVVKTLNTMLFSVMTNPAGLSKAPAVFLSGDDEGAKAKVKSLLQDLGWQEDWVEDLGGIASAQGTEAFILLVPHVFKAKGFVPFAMTIAM